MFFVVYAEGNYSDSFGWDGGCSNIMYIDELSIVNVTNEKCIFSHKVSEDREFNYELKFEKLARDGKVNKIYHKENGGNRIVKMIVIAETKVSAEEEARKFLNKKFPAFG